MIINLRIQCLIKEYGFVISLLRDVFTCKNQNIQYYGQTFN